MFSFERSDVAFRREFSSSQFSLGEWKVDRVKWLSFDSSTGNESFSPPFRTFLSFCLSSFKRFLISFEVNHVEVRRERERERPCFFPVSSFFFSFLRRIVSLRFSCYIYIATFVPSLERKTWSDKRPMGKILKLGRNFLFAFTFRAKDVLYSFSSHRLSISFDIFVFFLPPCYFFFFLPRFKGTAFWLLFSSSRRSSSLRKVSKN